MQATTQSSAPRRDTVQMLGDAFTRYGIVIAFFALCVILAFANPYFMTRGNVVNVLRQTSINGILAVGMTFVVLTGGIDLSVGSVLAFCGIVSASFVTGLAPWNPGFAVLLGVFCGLVMGSVNGLLVAKLRVPPFVATLGMLSVARGLTFIYNNGMPVPNLSAQYRFIGQGLLIGIPVPVLVFAFVAVVAWFVLRYTTYGRYIYAVGGNERSAKTSGINTRRIILSVYAVAGALAGLSAQVLTARTTSALPQAGVAYELDAIAAVVIGGTSLSGGIGGVTGTIFGALIIGVINNGLDLMGVSSYYQQVIKGTIIVLAVLLDYSRQRND